MPKGSSACFGTFASVIGDANWQPNGGFFWRPGHPSVSVVVFVTEQEEF